MLFASWGVHIKKTLFASQRDKPEIIQEREEWRAWMENLSHDDLEHLVFLDEACAKTNLTPLYGWALKGERCYGRQPCKWERYTMLSSIRIDGSTENILFEKGLNKEIFQSFINDVLLPELRVGDIVIMDNCQAHKINFDALEKKGIKVKRLPRYSPDFNPIENMWSQIKGKLRKKEPRDFLALWREVSIAHLEITAENASGWFRGCGYSH